MKKNGIRAICFITLCMLIPTCFQIEINVKADTATTANISSVYGTGENAYKNYIIKYKSIPSPQVEINVDITNFNCSSDYATIAENIGDKKGKCIETGVEGYVEWEVNIENEGLYNICLEYYPSQGKGSSIIRSLLIDGQLPFDEAGNLTFSRSFTNANEIINDMGGNQIRPTQIEKPMWMTTNIFDSLGYNNEPLKFYLSKGLHQIRFETVKEPMTISAMKFYQTPKLKDYSQLSSDYIKKGYLDTIDEYVEIQGEQADLKSDNAIYPISDFSSPATHPSSYSKILLNTIGGSKWQNTGQWVSWQFNVPKTGLYKIGVTARQNVVAGQASYRSIYIDGEIPCAQLNAYKFPYDTSWKAFSLGGDENPYKFYLTEGMHTIKMKVSLGELTEFIQSVNASVNILNKIYMDLLMVTGPVPDKDRNYSFEKIIPDVLKKMNQQSIVLNQIYDDFIKLNEVSSSQTTQLLTLSKQLKKMSDNPEKIASLFYDFVINISILGSWVSTVKQQPLEIDYISVASKNVKLPNTDLGIISNIVYSIQQFFASFFIDYSNIGATNKNTSSVRVWITSGRDQANSLNQLTKNFFTSETGINVNIQLVPYGSLLTAVIANKGPDVVLSNFQNDPLNYAIRGAVVDLKQFDDFPEIAKRFQNSAMEPLTFNGHVYGLPETQNFPMLFYRTDILNELNISVPQTWDDVIGMLPILQKKNLSFGLPQPYMPNLLGMGMHSFATFLYQMDGKFYNEGGISSALDSDQSINAFFKWIKFYNEYFLPAQYDFNTRFRSGEVPIGIADYGTYNILSVFAPELDGMWKFSLVPGTKKADGTIDRTIASIITATIMMQNSKNKNDAWEFMKWFSSAETQEQYGNELESIMGIAARYQTANIQALYHIPWSTKDFKILMEQWQLTKGIPEVPGSYMTSRYLDFAFKRAYIVTSSNLSSNNLTDPGEILQDQVELINDEITDKRREFGLPNLK